MHKPDKNERQNLIQVVLREKKISTQDELQEELQKRGYEVNQSALSRDLRELSVIKRQGAYTVQAKNRLFKECLFAGENLVVVRTAPGQAMSLAAQIDAEELPYVVGTIAGDDTIFVAILEKKHGALLSTFISRINL